MPDVLIATSRYSNHDIAGSGYAPIGITQGFPRFKLAYDKLFAYEKRLAPTRGQLAIEDHAEFAAQYSTMLEQGATRYWNILIEHMNNARAAGYRGIVLLCYEDVRNPGEHCHRIILANWIKERWGVEVHELDNGAPPKPKAKPRAPKPDAPTQARMPVIA